MRAISSALLVVAGAGEAAAAGFAMDGARSPVRPASARRTCGGEAEIGVGENSN